MNKNYFWLIALLFSSNLYAQKSDGSVKSLVNAEKALVQKVAKEGANAGFTSFSSPEAIVFRPNPVNAVKYFSGAEDTKNLKWDANYARLSKSRDWGFTSGSFEAADGKKTYGHYLSIWNSNNGNWRLVLNMTADASKPIKGKEAKNSFIEPTGNFKSRLTTAKDLKVASDIIYSTEKTLNTMLKTHGVQAFSGFLNQDARLMFPGTDAILGKDDILTFNNRVIDKINLKTTIAEKALGGDFAYTHGLATIDYKADLRESFHYIFIWERQADANWNIIAQIFTLADR